MKEYDVSGNSRECSAGVEGLVRAHLSKVDGTVRGAFHRETAERLTALQVENERLHDLLNGATANLEDATARAEKAEAERDAWKANAEALAEAAMRSRELTSLACDEGFNYKTGDWVDPMFKHNGVISHALAAHAKLKGGV